MKNRLLCLLLTLLLALGAVPALGEGAEAVKPPEAGDVAHGFEALAQIAREGFDPALADAVATRLRMDAKLARENGNPADFIFNIIFISHNFSP